LIPISIITTVLNSSDVIEKCLTSIYQQDYPIEHIIIDGKSTDNTLHKIKPYEKKISRIISEKDEGIYDALNKGISIAGGEVIGFLHADDFYPSSDTLSKIASIFVNNAIDSCYGDLIYVDYKNTDKIFRYWISGQYHYKHLYWGWMPPHPTFFVRRKIYEKYGVFNLSMGSAADYELILRFLLKYRITAAYIPEVLVKMRTGGVSNSSLKNRIRANRMDRVAWKINGIKPYFWTLYLKPLRKIFQYIRKPSE
jgi:glycosyltransferase